MLSPEEQKALEASFSESEKKLSRLRGLGWIITGTWIFAVTLLAFSKYGTWHSMELNQWGDFAAGAFSPLALLWVVLGYMQQGLELRQNTSALRLQLAELRSAVQQAETMATTSKEKIDLDRRKYQQSARTEKFRSQPIFECTSVPPYFAGDERRDILIIGNSGHLASRVDVTFEDQGSALSILGDLEKVTLDKGQSLQLEIAFHKSSDFDCHCVLRITYLDGLSEPEWQLIKLRGDRTEGLLAGDSQRSIDLRTVAAKSIDPPQ